MKTYLIAHIDRYGIRTYMNTNGDFLPFLYDNGNGDKTCEARCLPGALAVANQFDALVLEETEDGFVPV